MKLKTTLLIIIFQFSNSALFAQEFGIQLYSLRNQFNSDIEKSLKTISDWGINTIEGGDTYGMEESEFRSLLKKYELNPISIGASYDELKEKVKSHSGNNLRFPKDVAVSEECKNLLINLLQYDAKNRIEWKDFFNHITAKSWKIL